ncbi:MAG: DNA ligase [Cardiobacteriaceae bacterium]|nr:DNA ligase [Cardiobacteriaceae bacterium]
MRLVCKCLIFVCLSISNLPVFAELMLAQNYHDEEVIGWLASEKLDGIRAYWDGKKLISRSGKEFLNTAEFVRDFPNFPIDGELWIARGEFEQTMSKVRSGDYSGISFNIFDVPGQEGGVLARLQVLENYLNSKPELKSRIKVIPQKQIRDINEARKMLFDIERQGGEGVMLRHPDAPYVPGRTDNMLKLKSKEDAECRVTKHYSGNGRNVIRLGSLDCKDLSNGITVRIGTGFTDAERDNPPPVGAVITYRYSGYTAKGKPRFPTFYRVYREPIK